MKKKIGIALAITVPAVLFGATVIGYQDWQLRGSAPGNPATGYFRVWADQAGQYFKCLTSAGAPCYFDPKATSSSPGIVQPDGTTITVSGGVISATATGGSSSGSVAATGTTDLGTAAIASGACAPVVTSTASAVTTSDLITYGFNTDPTAISGYAPTTAGNLAIFPYPGTGNVNFKVCNSTAASITPAAATLNWAAIVTPGSAGGGGGEPPSSGMVLWLSADCITYSAGTCSTLAEGGVVNTWDDRSGNGNNLNYTVGTKSVLHTAQINGLPAVSVTNSQYKLSTSIPASTGYSAFAVIKLNGTSKGDLIAGDGLVSGAFKWWFTNVQGVDQALLATIGSGTTNLGTTWHQCNVTYTNNSTSLSFRVDRSVDPTGTVAAEDLTHANRGLFDEPFNSSELLDASVAEIIFYNRVLSSTEITQVESYLHGKYGL